jgi:predicted dehydrogenase
MISTVIIGAGAMGKRHIEAVKLTRSCRFCGISDIKSSALEQVQAAGIDRDLCFPDAAQMLRKVKPACVIVASTAKSHAALAELAVHSGARFLLVEKPMCVSIAQALKLRGLCRDRGVRLAVNHCGRYDAIYQKIKELSRHDGLGPLTSMTFNGGNIGLAMGASHQFEFFRYMTGQKHTSVAAWFAPNMCPNPRGEEFLDAAGQCRLETPGGQRQYIEIGPDQGHGYHVVISFALGQIQADLLAGRAVLSQRKPEFAHLPPSRYGSPADVAFFDLPPFDVVRASAGMLEALLDGGDYPDGEVGEWIVRTLVAAYVSHENGHVTVDINGNLPETREFPWA